MLCSAKFSMTVQTEIRSTETSDILKHFFFRSFIQCLKQIENRDKSGKTKTQCENCLKFDIPELIPYLVSSEYFAISRQDNFTSNIDRSLVFQCNVVLYSSIVHVYKISLQND